MANNVTMANNIMIATEVIYEITRYIGNSWLPCALISREICDHLDSSVTSAEIICRTPELAEWVF